MSDEPETTEPAVTASAAAAATHASPTEEDVARQLHDRSVFAAGPHGVAWDKVDGVMRERRMMQAHDIVALGYIQRANLFYGFEDPLEERK